MDRRTTFEGWLLPALLVLPQLLLTIFFFLWPAAEALWSSLATTDPFGQGSVFVGLDNFAALFSDPLYLQSILRTVVFCAVVSVLAMSVALALARTCPPRYRSRWFIASPVRSRRRKRQKSPISSAR